MTRDLLRYLGALLLFGSNGVVASAIDLPSHEIVLARTLLGTGVLALVLLLLPRARASLAPREALLVAGSGAAMGTCWILVYMAYREIGVGFTSLLYALGPVLVLAASPLLFRERLTAPRLLGFAVVLVGAVLVNGAAWGSGAAARGILHGLLAALAYAAMIALSRAAGCSSGLVPSALQLLAATATVALGIAVLGWALVPVPAGSLLPALVLGTVNTGLGCYLYFSSIGRLRAQTVATCDYLEPLTAVVLAAALLGERLSAGQVVGAVLVLAGAVGAELAGRARPSRPAAQEADGAARPAPSTSSAVA